MRLARRWVLLMVGVRLRSLILGFALFLVRGGDVCVLALIYLASRNMRKEWIIRIEKCALWDIVGWSVSGE